MIDWPLVHSVHRPLFPLGLVSLGGCLVSRTHGVHLPGDRSGVHVRCRRRSRAFTNLVIRIDLSSVGQQPLPWSREVLVEILLRHSHGIPSHFHCLATDNDIKQNLEFPNGASFWIASEAINDVTRSVRSVCFQRVETRSLLVRDMMETYI